MADRTRLLIGFAIALGSILVMFWWGFHFGVFGRKIHFTVPFVGFFAWIVFGIFGVGYGVGGVRAGAASAGWFIVLVVGAALLGVTLGNYR